MKTKIFLTVITAVTVVACNPRDIGAEHAIEFVREQVPELVSDIESIEVIGTDTLLGLTPLVYAEPTTIQKNTEYLKGELSGKDFKAYLDSMNNVFQDISFSWEFGIVTNDSLMTLSKYEKHWRKVYKVCVTMKSGIKKYPRVLMDHDGITPEMLEKNVERESERLGSSITQGYLDLNE